MRQRCWHGHTGPGPAGVSSWKATGVGPGCRAAQETSGAVCPVKASTGWSKTGTYLKKRRTREHNKDNETAYMHSQKRIRKEGKQNSYSHSAYDCWHAVIQKWAHDGLPVSLRSTWSVESCSGNQLPLHTMILQQRSLKDWKTTVCSVCTWPWVDD